MYYIRCYLLISFIFGIIFFQNILVIHRWFFYSCLLSIDFVFEWFIIKKEKNVVWDVVLFYFETPMRLFVLVRNAINCHEIRFGVSLDLKIYFQTTKLDYFNYVIRRIWNFMDYHVIRVMWIRVRRIIKLQLLISLI